jgi:hypothetical protein
MKKKSKYKPKPVRPDTLTYVVAGFKKIADIPDAGTKILLRPHISFDEILEGRGDQDHANNLINMVNMCEALAVLGLGRDWLPEINEAQDVLHEFASRSLTLKRFVFYGPEIIKMREIMELHDEQLKNCSVKKMEEAIDLIQQAHKHGKMRKIEAKQ